MHWRAVEISWVTLMGASNAWRNIDLEETFEEDVVAPVLVHQRAAGLARFSHVVDGGQRLEVERDGGCDILGLGARRRHAHRHHLADMADLAGREHRLLGDLETGQRRHRADRLYVGEIIRREDHIAIAFRNMDGLDAGMRQRAAHEGDVLQARQSDVGDELAAATQEAIVFLAQEPGADTLTGFRGSG